MKEYEVEYNVNLKKYNSYGINVNAKYLIRPRGINELKDIINYLKKENINYYILGGGTNVILPDNDFDGAIIKLDHLDEIRIEENFAFCSSGVTLQKFINILLDNGYTNLALLSGIPGTIGGALIGNAGAYKKEIYDDVVSILVLEDDLICLYKKENIKYEYRNTEFKNKDVIILGATFKIEKGNVEEARKVISANLEARKEKQPLEYKNAGSVFKNPLNTAAGKLIEESNLKGYNVNDAYVSNKHANFIVNMNNATSNDIKEVIKNVQKKVKEDTNIDLELEQIIVKW